MRTLLIGILGSALLLGCGSRPTPHSSAASGVLPTNAPSEGAEAGPPITHGDIVARIVGPYRSTPGASIPGEPNALPIFWVTLEVVEGRDGFAPELKGKTIRLPTCEFDRALVGQTLPLRVSYSPGRFQGSDYWLTCTSIQGARLAARAITDR